MSAASIPQTPPKSEHESPCEQLRGPIRALAALFDLLGGTTLDETQRRYLTLSREALASLNDGLDDKAKAYAAREQPGVTDDLAGHRAAVVAVVAARDVAAAALVVGAIRVQHPLLAARLEQRLGRREWASLISDVDDAIADARDAAASPITPEVIARFVATVHREHARLAAEMTSAIDAATDPEARQALSALVTTMSHRFAGSAASFGHTALGDEARAVSLALRTSTDEQLEPLAQQLLAALAAVVGSRR